MSPFTNEKPPDMPGKALDTLRDALEELLKECRAHVLGVQRVPERTAERDRARKAMIQTGEKLP